MPHPRFYSLIVDLGPEPLSGFEVAQVITAISELRRVTAIHQLEETPEIRHALALLHEHATKVFPD